jgi:hypothetical protein
MVTVMLPVIFLMVHLTTKGPEIDSGPYFTMADCQSAADKTGVAAPKGRPPNKGEEYCVRYVPR